MGSKRHLEILEAVLETAVLQRRLFEEKRFDELLLKQKEREALFAELSSLESQYLKCGEARSLIVRILENDRVLSLCMESSMEEIAGKLGRIKKGAKVVKAYGASAR
ncbi:MAG: flagellar protein FliT [Deltaproteobacteria bacterium]|nr:flagellar protein FliT [Deltaproteobacteria bacterium]